MSTDAPASSYPALDAETARRVAGLKVRATKAVQGLLGGMHRSPHRGASVVFVEHRAYRPGDDLRLLDWRAFARTDRHAIKRFEQETQLRATLLIDRSASMGWRGFAGEGPSKHEHAATLLGALAYVLHRQGDAVSAIGLGEHVHPDAIGHGTRPSHLEEVLRVLARAPQAKEGTALGPSLEEAAQRTKRRGVVVFASDLLGEDAHAGLEGLVGLTARGHDVLVLHVLHPDELQLPEVGAARFVDPESGERLDAETEPIREAYEAQLEAFLEDARRRCTAAGAAYVLASMNEPPERTLARALGPRRRR